MCVELRGCAGICSNGIFSSDWVMMARQRIDVGGGGVGGGGGGEASRSETEFHQETECEELSVVVGGIQSIQPTNSLSNEVPQLSTGRWDNLLGACHRK